MADWSVVAAAAVTGLTSVASGTIGYAVAQSQARAQERQARELRKDELQQARKDTYHAFLDVDRQLPARLTAGMEVERADIEQWLDQFNHCYNAVLLIGTDAVTHKTRELFADYLQLYEEATSGGTSWPTVAHRRALYQSHRPKLDETRMLLIEAMRLDVSSGSSRS
jgi:hypothetical protein